MAKSCDHLFRDISISLPLSLSIAIPLSFFVGCNSFLVRPIIYPFSTFQHVCRLPRCLWHLAVNTLACGQGVAFVVGVAALALLCPGRRQAVAVVPCGGHRIALLSRGCAHHSLQVHPGVSSSTPRVAAAAAACMGFGVCFRSVRTRGCLL